MPLVSAMHKKFVEQIQVRNESHSTRVLRLRIVSLDSPLHFG